MSAECAQRGGAALQYPNVYATQEEFDRLAVQNDFLARFEAPVLERLLRGKTALRVLDIGCNDGAKTVSRFATDAVAQVIGVDSCEESIARARALRGGGKFRFEALDVESDAPEETLAPLARSCEGFDLICLSCVLMHLREPERLLRRLRPLLKAGGSLFIVEANDDCAALSPDPQGLLPQFLSMLACDPYAGDRRLGARLPAMLGRCGYEAVCIECDGIRITGDDAALREGAFGTYFSYVPTDVRLLCAEAPQNPQYRQFAAWTRENFPALRGLVLRADTDLTLGVRILTCTRRLSEGEEP